MARRPPEFREHPIGYRDAVDMGGHRGVVQHIVDGDTLDVFLDLGFFNYVYVPIRLMGIDTPEIFGVPKGSEQYERGIEAREWVVEHALDRPCVVYTFDRRSFDRFVGTVQIVGGFPYWYIGDRLLDEGLAVEGW